MLRQVGNGIMMVVIGIVTLTLFVMFTGYALDAFIYEFFNLDFAIVPELAPAFRMPAMFASMFYYLIPIGSILWIAWGFKLIIFKHEYQYEDEEENEW